MENKQISKKNLTETEVDKRFEEFLEECHRCQSEEKKELLRKAYNFAKIAHKGQKRYNGDVYISHPLEVANIVTSEIGLGTTSAVAALLHDTITETDTELEDIKSIFGDEIANLVKLLSKIKGSSHFFTVNKAEVYKRLLVGISQDIRVIYIKIADRLHNMRTLDSLEPDQKHRVATETLYVYAPLAVRLGLYSIKMELEDLAFKYLSPHNYNVIAKQIKDSHFSNIMYLNRVALPIIHYLRKAGFEFDIHSRQKTIYSIWQKIKRKGVTFNEVYDLFAIRIIYEPKSPETEKQEAFEIKNIIEKIYPIKPDRTRDWINNPKENGYEALHITVLGPNDRWIEIQIRSKRMHDIAEHGFASHWKYKGIEYKKIEFNEKIQELRKKLENVDADDFDFLSDFKLLFTTEIVTYTPKGKEIILPVGATALDFAFYVHTDIALKAIAAKVNNIAVPLNYQLQNGDSVYIITSSKQLPSKQWLDFVKTQKAKQTLMAFFKDKKINEKEVGMNILFEQLKDLGLSPNHDLITKLIKLANVNSKHELYVKVGSSEISKEELNGYIKKITRTKFTNFWKSSSKKVKSEYQSDIVVAKCCNPIPGDEIIILKEGDKTIVHRKECPKVSELKKKPQIFSWHHYMSMNFTANIHIEGENRKGLLLDIMKILSQDFESDIKSVFLDTSENDFFVDGLIELKVLNKDHLNKIMNKLMKIEGIKLVERVI